MFAYGRVLSGHKALVPCFVRMLGTRGHSRLDHLLIKEILGLFERGAVTKVLDRPFTNNNALTYMLAGSIPRHLLVTLTTGDSRTKTYVNLGDNIRPLINANTSKI